MDDLRQTARSDKLIYHTCWVGHDDGENGSYLIQFIVEYSYIYCTS